MDQTESYFRKLKQLLPALQKDGLQHQGPNLACSLVRAPQQLHLSFGSSGGSSSFQSDDIPPITLKSLPGRGIGVIATRLIPAGGIVLKEEAVLTVPEPPKKAITLQFIADLVDHYAKLPTATRQQVLELHAYSHPIQERNIRVFLDSSSGDFKLTESHVDFVIRLYSIFATNSFGKTTSSTGSLYLGASRFNHSCLPNCDYGHTTEGNLTTITVCSGRDIHPGEEITVAYLSFYHPRDDRRACTELTWGFSCNCPACDIDNPTVDTVAHEQRLDEYRRLKEDPCLRKRITDSENSLTLEELEEASLRSARRAQIAESLGDNYIVLREYVFASLGHHLCLAPVRY